MQCSGGTACSQFETQYKRKEATKANQVLLDAKARAAIASQSFLGNELPVMLQKLSYCHNAEAEPVGRRSLQMNF